MSSETGDAPGRQTTSPWQMPWPAWRQVLVRSWSEAATDNIGLISAGVAFYAFLALVPMLGAVVLTYGLVASPASVIHDLHAISGAVPAEAAKLIDGQLLAVVKTSDGKKGLGLAIALLLALYGAMKGASAIVTALNIAYEEDETRGFIKLNALALAMTIAAVVVAVMAIVAIAALGHLEALFPKAPDLVIILGKVATYAVLAGISAGGAATVYRYAPDRQQAKWTWLTPGSLLATAAWLAVTLGFGIYAANFGSYGATYGALGGVVVLLTWLYLSAYVLLFGAELNSELEHQTARDTTTGAEKAIGTRRATVADSVAGLTEDRPGDAAAPGRADRAEPAVASASVPTDYIIARAGGVVARQSGPAQAGKLPTLAAVVGLSLLAEGNRRAAGAALLALGGLLAWREGKFAANTRAAVSLPARS